MAPSTPSTLFLAPSLAHSSISRKWHSPVFQPIINRGDSAISYPLLRLEASASPLDVPIGGAPVVVLAAIILAVAAQSWINSLLCGDRGLGAFLSDGTGFDGTSGVHSHMTNSRLTDPEVLEWRFPVVLDEFRIRDGSGGGGRFQGGDGVVRRIRFLEPMTVAILSGHRTVPPPGLDGGDAATCGITRIERADGTVETLAAADRREIGRGDTYWIETPGGGGYGKE